MLFKAKFDKPVNESILDNFHIDFSTFTGKEILYFKNHEFELERDYSGMIKELTYCNQCVQTYDIENIFIELIFNLINKNENVILSDSDGFTEELTKNDLLDLF